MMYETLNYIEAYFQQELSQDERTLFEQRCINDEAFAKEVAFYVVVRGAAREALPEQKQEAWSQDGAAGRLSVLKKWLPYAAAACLIFIVSLYFLLQNPTPQWLAADYINHVRLSHAMDSSKDSTQLGIEAYKQQDYLKAQALFDGLRRSDPANDDAKKFAGLAYLQTKNYDKALECFDELSAMKGLHVNSGDFLKANALLIRDLPGDRDKAKLLLEKVAREQEDGSIKAREWLKQWE